MMSYACIAFLTARKPTLPTDSGPDDHGGAAAPAPQPPAPAPARRKGIDWTVMPEVIWRTLVFIVALTILIVVTTRWNRWQGAAGWQQTDDAYLQSDLTPIAAKVPGYVRAVPVQDFDQVKAGQLIAEIVDDEPVASRVFWRAVSRLF